MEEIKIKVNGMVCEGCENRIKNVLSTLDGIQKVEANHEIGIVVVTSSKEILRSYIEEKINNLVFEIIKED